MNIESKPDERVCANCACSEIKTAPGMGTQQMFCRRDTPQAAEMRVEQPVMDASGKPMFLKDGKTPRVMEQKMVVYLYKPVEKSLTCFDGWRPVNTLPGEKWEMNAAAEPILNAFKRLREAMAADAKIDWPDTTLDG